MFEADPSLYERIIGVYGDFLALLPRGEVLSGVALSPALWAILWITIGSPRILPWKK